MIALVTEATSDAASLKSKPDSLGPAMLSAVFSKEEKDMQVQIEDLLTALSEMQREQAAMATMLQKEKEAEN